MSRALSALRRLVPPCCVLLLALSPAIARAAQPGCIGFNCDPTPFYSTLTIATPAAGAVAAAGTNGASYTCSAADTSGCSITDEVDSLTGSRPTRGWPTYTLTWSGGPANATITWTGACTGASCSVVNNVDNQSVGEQFASVWTDTVTVSAPQRGEISDGAALACYSSGGACSFSDSQTVAGLDRPTSGWPAHTLTWTGPDGTTRAWTGACASFGSADCVLTNDQPSATLGIALTDTQAPVLDDVTMPARSGPTTYVRLYGSDNWAVALYRWTACVSGECSVDNSSVSDISMGSLLGRYADEGAYTFSVVAVDAAGNASAPVTAQTTYFNTVTITVDPLAAVTAHPSITFASDEDDHVPAANRLCRAELVDDGNPPDYAPCTTGSSFTPDVTQEGDWLLEVFETDDLGNHGYATVETIVDRTAPALAFTGGPPEGATVGTIASTWTFTATDDYPGTTTCQVDAGAPVACDGSYTITYLANGQHRLTITSTDAAGNATTIVRRFSSDVVTRLTTTTPTVSTTYGTAAPLGVSVIPARARGRVVFTLADGTYVCTGTVTNGAASCAGLQWLRAGSFAVTATYTGGYGTSTRAMHIVVAKAATAVTATLTPAPVTRGQQASVTLGGLGSHVGGRFTVTLGSYVVCSGPVTAGVASCSFLATQARGTHSLTVAYKGDGNNLTSSTTVDEIVQ